MYLTIAIASGGLVALMILVNGGLQDSVGALPALLFIHATGLIASLVYLAFSARAARRRLSPESGEGGGRVSDAPPDAPRWFAAAGVLGIGVVFLNNLIFAKGGVLLALGGTLAGQTLAAHLLEGTRWFDGRRSPRAQRILSLGLILPGAAIIGWRSGVGIGWIAVSWVPGMLLMVQSMMNTRNVLRYGPQRMLVFNYSSALLVLVPLFLLLGLIAPAAAHSAGRVITLAGLLRTAGTTPPALLLPGGVIGVVVVGSTTFLFGRSSAVKVVLALYAGQIAVGILIDSLSGLPLSVAKLLGVAMVLVGLAAGELRRGTPAGVGSTPVGRPTGEGESAGE